MNGKLAARIATDSVDDDAWVAFTAAHQHLDPDRLRAVFTGRATTNGLPDAVAAELVARLTTREAVIAATCGDRRAQVNRAVAAFDGALDENRERHLAELVAGLNRAVADSRPRREPQTVAGYLADVARKRTHGLNAVADAAAAIIAGTSQVHGLDLAGFLPRLDVTSRIVEELCRHGRGIEVLQVLAGRVGRFDDAGAAALTAALEARHTIRERVTVTEEFLAALQGAVARFAALDDQQVILAGGLTAAHDVAGDLAVWFLRSGGPMFGVGSLADAFGVDIDAIDPAVASKLVTYATHAGRPDAVDEIAHTITGNGQIAVPIRDLSPTMCTTRVSSAALALAVRSPSGVAGGQNLAEEMMAALAAGVVDADEFLAAVEEHRPDIIQWVLPRLAYAVQHDAYTDVPPCWAKASMRHGGLEPWLERFQEVRRHLSATGAGIGPARWDVAARLLTGFRGTCEDLIAVTAELAPATEPTTNRP